MPTPALARWQVLGAAALFATGGFAIKACALAPWQVASFRSGVAAVVLLVAIPAARRGWTPRTLLVAAAYAATLVQFVLATKLTTAANAIFLQSTAPLFLLPLAPLVLGERLLRRDLGLMAALALGLALVASGAEPARGTAPDPPLGDLLGAGSALTWALTVMGLRALAREGADRAVAAAAAGNVLAFLAALPLALPVGETRPGDWAWIAYLGIVQIALAYALLTRGLRRVRALEAALLLLLEPVLNTLGAWAVHGERPGALALGGGALILVATALHALRAGYAPPPRAPEAPPALRGTPPRGDAPRGAAAPPPKPP